MSYEKNLLLIEPIRAHTPQICTKLSFQLLIWFKGRRRRNRKCIPETTKLEFVAQPGIEDLGVGMSEQNSLKNWLSVSKRRQGYQNLLYNRINTFLAHITTPTKTSNVSSNAYAKMSVCY